MADGVKCSASNAVEKFPKLRVASGKSPAVAAAAAVTATNIDKLSEISSDVEKDQHEPYINNRPAAPAQTPSAVEGVGSRTTDPSLEKDEVKVPQPEPPVYAAPIQAPRWRRVPYLSILPATCCAFMMYTSIPSVRKSHGYPTVALCVASSLSILGFLYLATTRFVRSVADGNFATRDRLKIAMCCLVMLAVQLQSAVSAAARTTYASGNSPGHRCGQWTSAVVPQFDYTTASVLQPPLKTAVTWGITAVPFVVCCYLLLFFLPVKEAGKSAAAAKDAKATVSNTAAGCRHEEPTTLHPTCMGS